jgi:predicted MFS family arabinose efflux permease
MGNWKLVFLFFEVITVISGLWLALTPIHEKLLTQSTSTFAGSFGLLKDKTVLMLFLGILFVVGVDVGQYRRNIQKLLKCFVDAQILANIL